MVSTTQFRCGLLVASLAVGAAIGVAVLQSEVAAESILWLFLLSSAYVAILQQTLP